MGRVKVECKKSEHGYPPGWVMQDIGPCFEVSVGLHPSEIELLRVEGLNIPSPVHAAALVDTGASMTVVHKDLLLHLNATIYRKVGLTGMGDRSQSPCPVFKAHIKCLDGDLDDWINDVAAHTFVARRDEVRVILGRDFLRTRTLVYEGAAGTLTITDVPETVPKIR